MRTPTMSTAEAPAISVILPVHNTGRYLPVVLESLFRQTAADIEIIAVNDGSTDDSLSQLEAAAARDARLVVTSQENRGLSAARNAGLKLARGRWIAFVDSDDWLAPDALRLWCERAEAEELDMLIGNGFRFRLSPDELPDRKTPLLHKQAWDRTVTGVEWIVRSVDQLEWPNWVWLQLINHEFLRQTQTHFVEGMLHEDTPWTLNLSLAAKRVGFLQQPLYGYRTNPDSLVNTPNPTVIHARARAHIIIVRLLAEKAELLSANAVLSRALVNYANMRGKHFFKLFRQYRCDPVLRAELVREFINLGLMKTMFAGTGIKCRVRATRAWFASRWYLLSGTVTKSAPARVAFRSQDASRS